MLPSTVRPFEPAVWSLLLCVGALLLGGCDGAGSKRASLYERLTGTWIVERLEGDIDYTNQLEQRHPQGVEITFQGGDGDRTYRITGSPSEDSTTVLAEGIVVLPGDNMLRMASGFGQFAVQWTYRFEASRAIFAVQSGSRTFLRTLFSGGSQNRDLKMTLAPNDE